MADLIRRADAIRETWKEPTYSDPLNVLTEMRDRLEALPSVEPERRNGKWLTEYLDGIPGRRAEIKYCSECCQVSPYRHNFCPNCGSYNGGE